MAATPVRGRPRGFDRERALDCAMDLFWRHGYEATSIAMLTKAMGIGPPSLYAAFGDKRRLFSEAVQRYADTWGSYVTQAFAEETTARGSVELMLRLAAAEYANAAHPPGCLVISGAVHTAEADIEVKEELRGFREAAKRRIADSIIADIGKGLVPQDADPDALAGFYAAVIQGMNTQALDGAGRPELDAIADIALRAWPR